MYHNRFAIQIDLIKSERFKGGGCADKNTGSSHLKSNPKQNKFYLVHSLRSKRFRLVSEQRKTEEGDFRF